jgi:Ca2+-binding RTX toxin-like protein
VVAGNGNSIANTLVGNSVGNSLNGGAGIDSLVGGAGNDTYFIDNRRDIVSETEENGTDLVVSSISYALRNNLENLQLTGAAWAGTGNSVANVITGNSLANRLNGLQGADTLIGSGGNDTFVVDNAGDSVLGGIGIDAVESRISSYTLGSTIENLSLLGSQAINGTGNSLSNAIYGNDLDNRLNGVVGSSTLGDFLFGGEGDDTLVVNSSLDYTEGGDGTDLVESTVNYVLGEEVENLTLLGSALVGEGNELDNVITGNSLGNTLKGQYGNDYLDGGQGNDVYIIDESDVVSETADNGVDTVMVSFEYATDWIVDDNIENVVVVGNTATIVRGNTIDNEITGSASDNVLDGMVGDDTLKGGDGADSLFGGEGYDMFYGGDGNDTIVADVYDFVIDGGTGSDWMISGSDLDLSDGRTVNIENIALNDLYELNPATGDTSLAEYQPTTAIGNSLDNQLWGNMVANILVGGLGSDLLSGGGGNDTLTIDALDSVIDGGDNSEDDGDWVLSNDSVSLIDGRIYGVENIVLTGISDSSAEGDDSDNKIFGNDGDNTLSGGYGSDYIDGGLGDDSLIGGNDGLDTFVGGDGNDTLLLESANVAFFDGGDGVDYIVSNVNVTMENMYSVETIILTGSEALTAEGNFEQNLIIGNSGSNTITGGGNFDTLTGNGAADLFVIGNADGNFYGNDLESESCFVLITDFAVGVDSLQLFGASSSAYAVDSTNPSQVLITSTDDSVGLVAKINVVSGTAGNILDNASFLS